MKIQLVEEGLLASRCRVDHIPWLKYPTLAVSDLDRDSDSIRERSASGCVRCCALFVPKPNHVSRRRHSSRSNVSPWLWQLRVD